MSIITWILVALFFVTQILYTLSILVDLYFYTRPVNHVDMDEISSVPVEEYPNMDTRNNRDFGDLIGRGAA